MPYSPVQLKSIWMSTDRRCDHCVRRLRLKSYGKLEAPDGWEVDHSRARAVGGTDHPNNLRPACVGCNRSKQADSSQAHRARNGLRHPPLSAAQKERRRAQSAAGGAALGGLVGAFFGPLGAVAGALVGGAVGHLDDPEGNMRIEDE